MPLIGNGIYIGRFSGETAAMIASAYESRVEADGGVVESLSCLQDRVANLKNLGLWDKASAVWLPHGYKEGKLYAAKGGASADLTHVRAGTRYRKGPSYVEQVPYNLVPNSNTLSGWSLFQSTVSLNATTAPDGSVTATQLSATASSGDHSIYKASISVGAGQHTFSVRIKYNNVRWIALLLRSGSNLDARIWFDIQNGVAGTTSGASGLTGTITPDNNGYYKLTVTRNIEAGAFCAYAVELANANGVTGIIGATGAEKVYVWGAQFVVGAERAYQRTTDRFNVPALDYTNSTCPALSLEPARTNLLLQSETFDNASWTKSNVTPTANNATAPDGLATADTILETTANNVHGVLQSITKAASATQYAYSIHVKGVGRTWVALEGYNGANGFTKYFDLTNVVVGSTVNAGAGFTLNSSSIVALEDEEGVPTGWYRCIVVFTTDATTALTVDCLSATADGTKSFVGDVTKGFIPWGSQLEAGSYATSYIPTTTGTVSRIADAVTALTGVSDLIGQTEGTLYFEGSSFVDGSNKRISLTDGTANYRILIGFESDGFIKAFIVNGGLTTGAIISSAAYTTGSLHKVALTYSENRMILAVDGVKVGEDLTTTIPACSSFQFADHVTAPFYGEVKSLMLMKTAITDAQAIAATTP